jgi:hypothetical protein
MESSCGNFRSHGSLTVKPPKQRRLNQRGMASADLAMLAAVAIIRCTLWYVAEHEPPDTELKVFTRRQGGAEPAPKNMRKKD